MSPRSNSGRCLDVVEMSSLLIVSKILSRVVVIEVELVSKGRKEDWSKRGATEFLCGGWQGRTFFSSMRQYDDVVIQLVTDSVDRQAGRMRWRTANHHIR